MKNSSNLGFVLLLLMALGCACPNLKNMKVEDNRSGSPSPNATPIVVDTTETPKTVGGNAEISTAKYNQLKNGMSYDEAVRILGAEGSEVSSSEIGKYKNATYKWDGANYSFIILTFQNDKLLFKSQSNLK